jgi:hypothetical protein
MKAEFFFLFADPEKLTTAPGEVYRFSNSRIKKKNRFKVQNFPKFSKFQNFQKISKFQKFQNFQKISELKKFQKFQNVHKI